MLQYPKVSVIKKIHMSVGDNLYLETSFSLDVSCERVRSFAMTRLLDEAVLVEEIGINQ